MCTVGGATDHHNRPITIAEVIPDGPAFRYTPIVVVLLLLLPTIACIVLMGSKIMSIYKYNMGIYKYLFLFVNIYLYYKSVFII